MQTKTGIYLIGLFIETSSETNREGKKSSYVTLTTGGRRGAMSVKYDANDAKFSDFFGDCELGQLIMLKVRLSALNNAIYYSLEEAYAADGFESVA